MSNIALARPGTIASVFIDAPDAGVSATKALGTDTGTFRIKAKRVRILTSCRVEDTTGDGDPWTTAHADLMPRTVAVITGFMVSGAAIGLAQLGATTNGEHGIKIWFHSDSRFIQGKVVFRSIAIDAGRDDPFVQVTIEVVFSDTDISLLEADTPEP